MDPATKTERRPFNGSCHCGSFKYIVYLTVPHTPLAASENAPVDRIYKCNCTICHKTAILHLRPPVPARDFVLLAPTDPFRSLGDYMCNGKRLHSFFCRNCGVRCFVFMGEGEVVDMTAAELGLTGQDKLAVWKATGSAAEANGPACYLSVNAHTIEAGQEGFDMIEWVDKKSIMYYDFLQDPDRRGPARYDGPYPGGCY